MATLTAQGRNEYQQLFDTCIIKPDKYAAVDAVVANIVSGKNRYDAVSAKTNIPWFFIGIIHSLECSSSFTCHLHNGDPLTARTVHVPKGYPKTGTPPFAWEDSAVDALKMRSLNVWADWSVPGILFQLEGYNGFGYRVKGIHSPYLWSFSNQYTRGKFTADGIYDPNAVSKQVGAAVLLRRLSEKQIAISGTQDRITQIKQLGGQVAFDPNHYNALAEQLQQLLNAAGLYLRVDGKAGKITSDAYHQVSGQYLKDDNR